MIRQLIRRTLREVYKMSTEEKEERREIEEFWGKDGDYARALGLQHPYEIAHERALLQVYQRNLKKNPAGLQMIKDFTSGKGKISVAHSIMYEGFAVNVGSKENYDKKQTNPFTKWLSKYGSKSRNVISTVSWTESLGNGPLEERGDNWQALSSFGFMMKGYPVYVSSHDVMSQTLGGIPVDLEAHQISSGIAKRTGDLSGALYGQDNWQWSGETLLDNWTPIGCYMSLNYLWDLPVMTAVDIILDAKSTGLPGWIIDDTGNYLETEWISDDEWEDDGDGLYEQFFT